MNIAIIGLGKFGKELTENLSFAKHNITVVDTKAQIIEEMVNQYDVILELNANGFRRGKKRYEDGVRYPYPSEKFWSIIANEFKDVKVIVNSDCHKPSYLNDEYMQLAREMAKRLNLNVIERL